MDDSVNQLLAEHQVVNYQLKSEAFDVIKQRRSANYKPNIWKYDFLQSLRSKYDGDEYKRRAEKLREKGKDLFVEAVEELAKLELIDMIRKLGLADLFAEEMQKTLQAVASSKKRKNSEEEEDLYITALRFRILRLHDYEGKFSKSKSTEIKGLLELFEASYLAFEGESILDDAKTFATETLRNIYSTLDGNLAKEVAHALELSTHWRVQWFDVKWRITMYENNKNTDETLLELAKLNFNTVQATLQKDLSDISRWWKNLALMEHLDFTRDRLAESFLCAVGLAYEPRYSCFRKRLTKITTMILIIDDVYDVYGSLEELEQFTKAVDRSTWQQICGEALKSMFHFQWAGFCKALFVESKWYNEGYFPSLQEYLSNALISSGGTVISVHSMLSVEHNIADDMVNLLGKNHDLVHNVSIIIRLCNDLGTSAPCFDRKFLKEEAKEELYGGRTEPRESHSTLNTRKTGGP
ncbi:hypothetical protein POUND7_002596 [Theobroma cacao]